MSEVILNEDTHTYTVDGVELPSATTILRFIRADLGTVNPSVLAMAAERGKAVHAACEMIDYGGDPEIIEGTEGYLMAYLRFLRDHRPEWVGIESPVCSPGRGFAGTIDRWGFMWDGEDPAITEEPTVLDLKTVGSPTRETYISLCAQTAAYAYCLGYNEGCRRYGLFLKANGDYRLFDCEEWEKKNEFSGLEVFAKCYAVHQQLAEISRHKRSRGGAK